MEKWTSSKLRKEYNKAVYCHPAYLILWRVHHAKCQIGWIPCWNQHCLVIYQQPYNADDSTLIAESEEELKNSLMRVEEDSRKVGLKLNIQTTQIMALFPSLQSITMLKNWKQWQTLFSWIQITTNSDYNHEIEGLLLLGRKAMTNADSIKK